jgi:hypothetical protein
MVPERASDLVEHRETAAGEPRGHQHLGPVLVGDGHADRAQGKQDGTHGVHVGERRHQVAPQQICAPEIVLGHRCAHAVTGLPEQRHGTREVGRGRLAVAAPEVDHPAVGQRLAQLHRVLQQGDAGGEGGQRRRRLPDAQQDQGTLAVQDARRPGGQVGLSQGVVTEGESPVQVALLGSDEGQAGIDAGGQVRVGSRCPGTLEQPPRRRQAPTDQRVESLLMELLGSPHPPILSVKSRSRAPPRPTPGVSRQRASR